MSSLQIVLDYYPFKIATVELAEPRIDSSSSTRNHGDFRQWITCAYLSTLVYFDGAKNDRKIDAYVCTV